MTEKQLILASKSPRRSALMSEAGLDFLVFPSEFEEQTLVGESADDMVMRLAKSKAYDVSKNFESGLVIGADTIVVLKDQILGKPKDEEDAFLMLKVLSGNTHLVYTGVCVVDAASGDEHTSYRCTSVTFRSLSDAEILRYIATKEPMDKAGAYAIQGRGSLIVDHIEGDYTNVVGLPMALLIDLLKRHNYIVL